MLYLVPTPIGNLGDMTPRGIEVLQAVSLILAEDTRTSGKLLKHCEISTKMSSFHAHNEHSMTPRVIEMLLEGTDIALITDAGTPAISDPGFLLVRACHEHESDIKITCLPGANAITPALAMSGIPCDRFFFEGFLPHKKGRQTRWKFLSEVSCTIVLYESTHRIIKLIKESIVHLGPDRQVAVIKEISKLHETIFRGTNSEVLEKLESGNTKGEFVVVIGDMTLNKLEG